MEITLISAHNKEKMFEVDYFGRTKVVADPLKNGKVLGSIIPNRKDDGNSDEAWTQNGDEMINAEIEDAVYATATEVMPSKMKIVIKFGYTESMIRQLVEEAKPEFPEFLESVMVNKKMEKTSWWGVLRPCNI